MLDRESGRFPEQDARIAFWKVCFLNLAGETDAALRTLADAIERGHWYGETWLRADPDLKSLQGHPEFERLAALSKQRAREVASQTTPTRLDISPNKGVAAPYPLLIALHANNSSARLSVDYWRRAAQQGWYLSLPMSTQAASSDTARWDDEAWAIREVQHHYCEITTQQPIDARRVVVGGFSMGGRLAVTLGLTGGIPATGVIAVGPALGGDIDRWRPYLDGVSERSVRVWLVVGAQDDPEFVYHPTIT